MAFKVSHTSGFARRGTLTTKTTSIETPVFMPVGTYGTVKGLTPKQLNDVGFEVILGNAFHLFLRPGLETIEKFDGLHKFMGWDKSILTDSGGFQIWSLKESSLEEAKQSMELTHRWAKRCKSYFDENSNGHKLFGIVQGGMHESLRMESLKAIEGLNFDGIALGGLSVGEPKEEKTKILRALADKLPKDKPHYVMGVGTPEELVEGVRYGIDMFDCVIPTRNARNGFIYTNTG